MSFQDRSGEDVEQRGERGHSSHLEQRASNRGRASDDGPYHGTQCGAGAHDRDHRIQSVFPCDERGKEERGERHHVADGCDHGGRDSVEVPPRRNDFTASPTVTTRITADAMTPTTEIVSRSQNEMVSSPNVEATSFAMPAR